MEKSELIQKIMQKKEFSQLPMKDVEMAFEKFSGKKLNDYQKVKLTRNFLRRIFSSFSSRKVFSAKDKGTEWYLMKHKSTKERLPFYKEVYFRSFSRLKKELSVIDLGAGINGFSYSFFEGLGHKINYLAVEAMGQFVDAMNNFFKKEKIKGEAFHLSLFEIEKLKELIEKTPRPRIVFLFKVIDSLEIVKRNYSKELINEIMPLTDRIVVSFATKSLGARKKFSVQRGWFLRFVNENFKIIDDFELNGERYIIFEKT